MRSLGSEEHAERQKAARALVEWGCRFPDAVLAELPAEDPDPEVRSTVERLRKAIPWASRYRTALDMAGKDDALRGAVEEMFRRPSPGALQALSASMGERREEAARILGWFVELEDPPRRPPTVGRGAIVMDEEGIEDGGNRTISCAALDLLRGIGRPLRAAEIAPLLSDPDAMLRSHASSHLALLPSGESVPVAGGLLSSKDAAIRAFGLELLVTLSDPSGSRFVAKALGDESAAVRAGAVQALEHLQKAEAVPALLPLLSDADPSVRVVTVHVAARLQGKALISRLGALLSDAEPSVRDAAAMHLERLCGTPFQPKEGESRVEAAAAWWKEHKDDPEYKQK